MPYHIVSEDAKYYSRVLECKETEDHHKYHDKCMRQFIISLCGQELVRYKDEYCNTGIADHVYMTSSRHWCIPCVSANLWRSETLIKIREDVILQT